MIIIAFNAFKKLFNSIVVIGYRLLLVVHYNHLTKSINDHAVVETVPITTTNFYTCQGKGNGESYSPVTYEQEKISGPLKMWINR